MTPIFIAFYSSHFEVQDSENRISLHAQPVTGRRSLLTDVVSQMWKLRMPRFLWTNGVFDSGLVDLCYSSLETRVFPVYALNPSESHWFRVVTYSGVAQLYLAEMDEKIMRNKETRPWDTTALP